MEEVVRLAGYASYAGISVDVSRLYDSDDPCYRVFVSGVLEIVNGLHERDRQESGE